MGLVASSVTHRPSAKESDCEIQGPEAWQSTGDRSCCLVFASSAASDPGVAPEFALFAAQRIGVCSLFVVMLRLAAEGVQIFQNWQSKEAETS